jgi:hypothetical protein
MANPETTEDHADETTTIQLREAGAEEKIVDETGTLKQADDVNVIAGNITDTRVRKLLDDKKAAGVKEFDIDVSQVGASEEVIGQLKTEQKKLREKGITMHILGLDSKDLLRADVKEMKQTTGVEVLTKRDMQQGAAAGELDRLAA